MKTVLLESFYDNRNNDAETMLMLKKRHKQFDDIIKIKRETGYYPSNPMVHKDNDLKYTLKRKRYV